MVAGEAWVLADSPGPAAELPTLAGRLATPVVAFVTDPELAPLAGTHGASAVHVVEPAGALGGPALAAAADAARARRGSPAILLFPMTPDGRDAGSRLSARWDRPVVTNALGVSVREGTVVADSEAGGGRMVVETAMEGPPPWLAGVRPRAVAPVERAEPGWRWEVLPPPPPPADDPGLRPRVVARHEVEQAGPRLEEAPVVVAAGRGVTSAEGYALVVELARLLGGAVGATRAAVDEGWAPHVAKVGLTGVTVAPEVYLAFGVSGASEHLVGMSGSRHVVAVNTDRHAPIFAVADLGVVGDATRVLSRLVAALRESPRLAEGPSR